MDDEWSLPDFTFSRRHKPATTVVRSIRRHYWGQIANFLLRAMMRSWRLQAVLMAAAALLVALVLIWLVRGRAMIAELEVVIMPPPPPIVWWAERMKSRMNDYLLRIEL